MFMNSGLRCGLCCVIWLLWILGWGWMVCGRVVVGDIVGCCVDILCCFIVDGVCGILGDNCVLVWILLCVGC